MNISAAAWNKEELEKLFALPLLDLVYKAQSIHRLHFIPNEVELCTLLNIKTGACPENCAYCSQSAHYNTGLAKEKLWDVNDIVSKAKLAKSNGATRFCMGAAWRSPPAKDFPKLVEIVKAVKTLGLETCLTAGMLSKEQANELKNAQLDYYNHNLDTSPEYYKKIISTHTYDDRLETLAHVADAGIKTCCGGILGMGETIEDRIGLLLQLTNLQPHPGSVPINLLIPVKGTPLGDKPRIDNFEFIRTVAVARIVLPRSMVRLSANRITMSEEMQALCFMAGANSIHIGEKLLTTPNPSTDKDLMMFKKLGITPKVRSDVSSVC